ncbi:hypothetical protein [Staphylothermus hellenicus]|uniref:Uncharacterized protein n=1 Tax=Staphylothermus hellenicus (strain DSM 12710 / JCM 10830 / BK20S6-10-b1 / P8) TaxID=591019 RepID=D7DBA7_STAHD|nr:hypothetical protein [Staphylothermus hellenicus]ADI31454.1 hypothetical protein Shell_0322 [Staphylothermus hellenicus DSM 12710]
MKNTDTHKSIEQYIVCRHDCPPRVLEALAMNGFAVKAWTENCEKERFKKIVVELFNGTRINSECRFDEEIKQSLRIINIYIGFARRNKAWEKLEIIEGEEEK